MLSALTATNICQPSLRLAVQSVQEFAPASEVHIFMPERVRCISFSNVTWHDFEPANPHIKEKYNPKYWYSVFMTDPSLWSRMKTQLVLVFQADTLLCSPIRVASFLAAGYDYIGGPSLVYGGKRARVPWNDLRRPLASFLNGGVALHRREWTLSCSYRMRNRLLNEDAKWNECDPTRVSALDALSFGSDNGFTGCFLHEGRRRCPSVLHKPWVHASARRLKELEKNCPRLEEMRHMFQKNKNEKYFANIRKI